MTAIAQFSERLVSDRHRVLEARIRGDQVFAVHAERRLEVVFDPEGVVVERDVLGFFGAHLDRGAHRGWPDLLARPPPHTCAGLRVLPPPRVDAEIVAERPHHIKRAALRGEPRIVLFQPRAIWATAGDGERDLVVSYESTASHRPPVTLTTSGLTTMRSWISLIGARICTTIAPSLLTS